jgi:hypothetical protein
MQLKIFLDINSYNFFLSQLSHRSMSWTPINTAVLMGRTRIVECDRNEARALLLQAEGFCPAAAASITEALSAPE